MKAVSPKRWRHDDWVELGIEKLKTNGPRALTLDQLCHAAGRTRGSFYHHFESVEQLIDEVAVRWRVTETDNIATASLDEPDALAALALMVRHTDAIDYRLERGIRMLATAYPSVRDIVEAADQRRESVMRDLLMRAYRLTGDEAASASRLFHALHQAAVMRSPEDIRGYTRATIRSLIAWLPKRLPTNPCA